MQTSEPASARWAANMSPISPCHDCPIWNTPRLAVPVAKQSAVQQPSIIRSQTGRFRVANWLQRPVISFKNPVGAAHDLATAVVRPGN
jgi:hypothetical protein